MDGTSGPPGGQRAPRALNKTDVRQLSFFRSRGRLALFGLLGGWLLNARVSAGGEFRLELLDPAGRIDVFQLAREERMASGANIDLQFLLGAAGGERITAAASNCRGNVIGVDAVFHGRILSAGVVFLSASNAPLLFIFGNF